jgi:4-hydroxybenzoate polyprenyltransferase
VADNMHISPDAPARNWVDRFAPPFVRPYARLARWDRPIGWWLLLLPCWWSAALAADSAGRAYPAILTMALFLVGAIAMRGAGCTYNDIVDRDLDASVARTRGRPIPSGQVSVAAAALFLVAQALVGLAVLLQFNALTIWLGLGSLALVALYPFLKRVTNWPQLGLGLAFSWGALLGWTAEAAAVAAAPLLLYAGCVLWVIGYDTIYALQDKEDDALVGIGSTAQLFGRHVAGAVTAFFGGAIIVFAAALIAADAGWAAYAGLAAGAVQLGWQAWNVRGANESTALKLFRSNRAFGLIVLLGLLADTALTRG